MLGHRTPRSIVAGAVHVARFLQCIEEGIGGRIGSKQGSWMAGEIVTDGKRTLRNRSPLPPGNGLLLGPPISATGLI